MNQGGRSGRKKKPSTMRTCFPRYVRTAWNNLQRCSTLPEPQEPERSICRLLCIPRRTWNTCDLCLQLQGNLVGEESLEVGTILNVGAVLCSIFLIFEQLWIALAIAPIYGVLLLSHWWLAVALSKVAAETINFQGRRSTPH